MNWILEHLQLVLAIAGAFAFWLKQRKESKAENEPTRPTQPATVGEADDADRARKIREEILRKIAERRGETPPATVSRDEPPKRFKVPTLVRPPHAPVDTFGGPSRPAVLRDEAPRNEPPVLVARGESQEAVLARQERLAQQMRDLEEKKILAQRRAAELANVKRETDDARERAASSVRRDLREPRALRHAMILREVLGTPVGLR